LARGAKQVQVVRHEHIAADEPGIGGGPGLAECAVNGVAGEDAFFVFRADGEENDGRVVGKLEHFWKFHGRFLKSQHFASQCVN
jgi:hypothetical protein